MKWEAKAVVVAASRSPIFEQDVIATKGFTIQALIHSSQQVVRQMV